MGYGITRVKLSLISVVARLIVEVCYIHCSTLIRWNIAKQNEQFHFQWVHVFNCNFHSHWPD